MNAKVLDEEIRKTLLTAQRNEITEHFVYEKLAHSMKDPHNRQILERISQDEREHYEFWRQYTHQEVKPDRFKIWRCFLISKLLGITFGLKLMERGEEQAQVTYQRVSRTIPLAKSIVEDEDKHEQELLALIDEERLRYISSVVLGLNDALVELTGTLAGLTLALQNARLIGMAGLITGIAASLSMGASEYLSTKSEEGGQNPLKASLYTGFAYVFTVLFLIFPYLLFANYYFCLSFTLVNAVIVIFIFNYYVSVTRETSFRSGFLEMVTISVGIAALTFGIGFLIRMFLNVEV